jgi:hypothetical protein
MTHATSMHAPMRLSPGQVDVPQPMPGPMPAPEAPAPSTPTGPTEGPAAAGHHAGRAIELGIGGIGVAAGLTGGALLKFGTVEARPAGVGLAIGGAVLALAAGAVMVARAGHATGQEATASSGSAKPTVYASADPEQAAASLVGMAADAQMAAHNLVVARVIFTTHDGDQACAELVDKDEIKAVLAGETGGRAVVGLQTDDWQTDRQYAVVELRSVPQPPTIFPEPTRHQLQVAQRAQSPFTMGTLYARENEVQHDETKGNERFTVTTSARQVVHDGIGTPAGHPDVLAERAPREVRREFIGYVGDPGA